MAIPPSIPRFLLPRAPLRLGPQPRAFLALQPATHLRHASASGSALSEEFRRRQAAQRAKATPVIPQPDKYRPPSHSKRTPNRQTGSSIYGPPLTEADLKRMANKKYPNMMSPEGSFSYWFWHDKAIHIWIIFSILVSLSGYAWYLEFITTTIYADELPTRKELLHHPVESIRQFGKVYKKHVERRSNYCVQQRLRAAEEIEKRKAFRAEREAEAEARGEEYVTDPRYYVGDDGVRRRRVKRWFGIWE
ncbi:hypothetical protein BDW02DRAFT_641430 [Decorospora gaudefroyi]|uniref:Uncharacterized protein n=1 Tax=Decorospora gaudefroyi TaxID=184978 RepID=A0A6A5K940_9PLEO|nr:hypothetical protein BDW02DRAFT_641430 [Decorospora gaudefroyi]